MQKGSAESRVIVAVHWLLGLQYLMSGLNWWLKILPFPNLFDPPSGPSKSAVVDAMVASGWMFTCAKSVEFLTALSLLSRRWVPLMLVVSFPVALMTFLMDARILPDLLGWLGGTVSGARLWAHILDMIFFGGCVLAMQGYLMLAYLDAYLPMLKQRNSFASPVGTVGGDRCKRPVAILFALFGAVALVLGVLSTGWMAAMVRQAFVPWSSLAILAPPRTK